MKSENLIFERKIVYQSNGQRIVTFPKEINLSNVKSIYFFVDGEKRLVELGIKMKK